MSVGGGRVAAWRAALAMRLRRSFLALPLLLPLLGSAAETLPAPESVLGFALGQDRTLADWNQIVAYLQRLADASPRVRLETVGTTTEGRPYVIATITSEQNLRRLEEIRREHARMADPRGLSEEDGRKLVESAPMVVVLTHGIHSTEVAGPQTAVETAWRLASARDPELLEVLDNVVVLLVPSQNPDGTQKVTEWYRRTLGTPYEGSGCQNSCRLPFLYHPYVGHDNNRDWYAFTQQETRLALRHIFHQWHPPLLHDVHQMGTRGPRLFVPPYMDPWEPNVDPALRAGSGALGMHVAANLTAQGFKGVAVHALFDAWTPARAYPVTHGGLRILSETAGGPLASPMELTPDQLEPGPGVDPRQPSWNHPAPWPGGAWRLRDQMDYQVAANREVLLYAARQRTSLLRRFLDVNRRASQRRRPYAFVVPAAQRDAAAATRLLQVLRDGEVELHRTRRPLVLGTRTVPPGSHVVLMEQPASAFAKTVLERQRYPDLRLHNGLPRRPYDATAHTLPLLFGVEVLTAEEPFQAELARAEEPVSAARGTVHPGRGRWLALPHTTSGLMAAGRLLRQGVPVRWALSGFSQGASGFSAGTLLVPSAARARVAAEAAPLGLDVRPVRTAPPSLALKAPRVGLYQSWVPSMDEGWTRFVFERQLDLPYRSLHDAEVRAGRLRERFDVIVLPDQSAGDIVDGHPAGAVPPEYAGGLGQTGVAALRAFVEEGGTLVALDASARFAIDALKLPVRDAALQWTRPGRRPLPEAPIEQGAAEFYAPGSLMEAQPVADAPLTHGAEPSVAVWFESSPAFEAREGARVVLRYPAARNPLLSGWLIGPEKLQGLGALAEAPLGAGRVVLFGFRPQYRAQSWGTYVLLLNAIYLSTAAPADSRAPGLTPPAPVR